MAEKVLDIIVRGKDDVSGPFGRVGDSLHELRGKAIGTGEGLRIMGDLGSLAGIRMERFGELAYRSARVIRESGKMAQAGWVGMLGPIALVVAGVLAVKDVVGGLEDNWKHEAEVSAAAAKADIDGAKNRADRIIEQELRISKARNDTERTWQLTQQQAATTAILVATEERDRRLADAKEMAARYETGWRWQILGQRNDEAAIEALRMRHRAMTDYLKELDKQGQAAAEELLAHRRQMAVTFVGKLSDEIKAELTVVKAGESGNEERARTKLLDEALQRFRQNPSAANREELRKWAGLERPIVGIPVPVQAYESRYGHYMPGQDPALQQLATQQGIRQGIGDLGKKLDQLHRDLIQGRGPKLATIPAGA